jgi:hypothetical protein
LDTTVYNGTLKYNKRSLIETSGNSAGHHKDYIHFLSEIKWWIKSGENTSEGYSWLQNKLKSMIKKSGNFFIVLYGLLQIPCSQEIMCSDI